MHYRACLLCGAKLFIKSVINMPVSQYQIFLSQNAQSAPFNWKGGPPAPVFTWIGILHQSCGGLLWGLCYASIVCDRIGRCLASDIGCLRESVSDADFGLNVKDLWSYLS